MVPGKNGGKDGTTGTDPKGKRDRTRVGFPIPTGFRVPKGKDGDGGVDGFSVPSVIPDTRGNRGYVPPRSGNIDKRNPLRDMEFARRAKKVRVHLASRIVTLE